MLQLFDSYAHLLKSWRVATFEQEGDAYLLQVFVVLCDDSRLEVRDYVFADGSRKYSYQWMETDGTLRWHAPHWSWVATVPGHVHLPGQRIPKPSTITDLEDLLRFVAYYFGQDSPHDFAPR